MRAAALAMCLVICLAGCSVPAGGPASSRNVSVDAPSAMLDNVADEMELPWAMVDPDLRFDPHSPASALRRPAMLADAQLGYFTDRAMIAQWTAGQRHTMASDHAGFVRTLDQDGDGIGETYRTGFWRKPDGREGTFLVVFQGRRQIDLIDTTVDSGTGVFLAESNGRLLASYCNCAFSEWIGYDGRRLSIRTKR